MDAGKKKGFFCTVDTVKGIAMDYLADVPFIMMEI